VFVETIQDVTGQQVIVRLELVTEIPQRSGRVFSRQIPASRHEAGAVDANGLRGSGRTAFPQVSRKFAVEKSSIKISYRAKAAPFVGNPNIGSSDDKSVFAE
jgi:hypothetical protein